MTTRILDGVIEMGSIRKEKGALRETGTICCLPPTNAGSAQGNSFSLWNSFQSGGGKEISSVIIGYDIQMPFQSKLKSMCLDNYDNVYHL